MAEKPSTPEQKATLRKVLYLNGTFFFIAGAVGLAMPSLGATMDLDITATRYVGIALMVVGATDFLIARFVFGNNERT